MKKIRADFSKISEGPRFSTEAMPAGLYRAKVTGCSDKPSSKGSAMLTYSLVPTDKKYATRCFPYYCVLDNGQTWKLRDILQASGQEVPKKIVMIDPAYPIGKLVAIEVADDLFEGRVRSTVTGVYSTDLLDDDDEQGPEPDELDDEDELDDDELAELDDIIDDDDDELDEEDEPEPPKPARKPRSRRTSGS